MIPFIITIDTEGDNLWKWHDGDIITTENSKYLPRFQNLCNEYSFKPVWLANWEMIHDNRFVDFVMPEVEAGHCEIGVHLHAWNNPPYFELPKDCHSGQPYLIEYPDNIMEEKIASITDEFRRIVGYLPVSHRAGRWAINETYLKLLIKYGYHVDCSITPGIDWCTSLGQTPGFRGPDYSMEQSGVSIRMCGEGTIQHGESTGGILEVPLTTRKSKEYFQSTEMDLNGFKRIKYRVKAMMKKERILSVRPDGTNLSEMKWVVDNSFEFGEEYIMFMIHSSELIPGCSPTFPDIESIESLYRDLKLLFSYVSENGYYGLTLKDFYMERSGIS